MILGDAGINYYLNVSDNILKEELSQLPITLFCIAGNHEEKASNISSYEEDYPNILFAQDGEIYDFNGKRAIAIGGAYSVDKYYRLSGGMPWFKSEQPDEDIKFYVGSQLNSIGWKIDYVFSHTVPLAFMPRDVFLPNINQNRVDNSTEKWLDEIERKLDYDRWYAGHFHVTWNLDKIQIIYEDFLELDSEW